MNMYYLVNVFLSFEDFFLSGLCFGQTGIQKILALRPAPWPGRTDTSYFTSEVLLKVAGLMDLLWTTTLKDFTGSMPGVYASLVIIELW